ncbi:MAG: glycosyltransferase [Candidatus Hydrogenedentes bacterium]|nr:glycosyltransferase [Candidatus Hydrogenedentota bacterium]
MKAVLKSDSLAVSVVIPALNEAPNLYRILPILREAMNSITDSWEVLVVDGDSQDGTPAVVAQAGDPVRYICEKERGYGRAILRGVSEARGMYIITMDADMSHPAEFIKALWDSREKADVVIASRYVRGGHADQPMFRYYLSRVLNKFFGKGLSIPVKDMSSGFRLYRKRIFEGIDLEFTNFVILVEILLRTYGKGLHIKEVPFHYQPRGSGGSHASIIKFGLDYLRLFKRIWAIRNSVQFPDYDWRAHNSRIWFQRYWQRKRYSIIMGFTPPFVSTCDVGCGSSHILADLPHAIGVDMRHDKLAFMRKTNKKLLQANGMILPFKDASFDCVISSEVIEHIPNEDGKLIDELTRILKPGGTLILGTPDYGGWQWPLIEWIYGKVAPGAYAEEHCTFYSYKSLREALESRGYEILDHGYICKAELVFKAVYKPRAVPQVVPVHVSTSA